MGATDMHDMKVRLSTLWVFAMFNYLYADVLTLMDPPVLKQIMSGQVGPMQMNQWSLFGAAILMESAIAMVLLSRVWAYSANRWANIIIGAVHTVAVAASLFIGGGAPAPYYLFCAVIEVACTVCIIGFAWRWRPAEAGLAAS